MDTDLFSGQDRVCLLCGEREVDDPRTEWVVVELARALFRAAPRPRRGRPRVSD